MISYYSNVEHVFVFVGREPLNDDATIPNEDIDPNNRLLIKCKPHSTVSPQNSDIKKSKIMNNTTNSNGVSQ